MSDYVKHKVLRIPWEKTNLPDYEDIGYEYQKRYPELFGYADIGKFQIAPTEKLFLDYVIDYDYGYEGEYGKSRKLYPCEKEHFLPIFRQIVPELKNMEDVRLVEYSWYNGTDAPNYYDPIEDPFNKPII